MLNSNTGLKVINASVAIVAQQHNPTIINADFLEKNEIIGRDWEVDNSKPVIITPILAHMSFSNKVVWTVEPHQCAILESIDGGEFKSSYSVYRCAEKYAEILKHIPYTALGMNWNLHKHNTETSQWITEHFLRLDGWDGNIKPTSFAFQLQAEGGAVCNLFCQALPQAKTMQVSCNFHFDMPRDQDTVARIREILQSWETYQGFLTTALNKYFRD